MINPEIVDVTMNVKSVLKQGLRLPETQKDQETYTIAVITASLLLISIGWCLLKAPSAPAAVLQNLEENTTNGVWITTM